MQSITDFTNMNGFRTQDAVLEPKMSTLLGRKKWGVGIKISVWKRERMKKFLWWGRDAGMKTWVWVCWGRGGLVLALLSSKKLVASVGIWGCSKKS